jgi:hypothetical protein
MPALAERQGARLFLVVSNDSPLKANAIATAPVHSIRRVLPLIADHSPDEEPYAAMIGALHGISGG